MLERIVAHIVVSLASWLDRRLAENRVAVDSDIDRDHLRRTGGRVREWLRSDGVRTRVDPDAGGADVQDKGVSQDRG